MFLRMRSAYNRSKRSCSKRKMALLRLLGMLGSLASDDIPAYIS
jgi:hypothetical protein